MKTKGNPILDAFEKMKEAQFAKRLAAHSELEQIAMLLSGNRLGFLGEKRSDLFLGDYDLVKKQLAKAFLEDSEQDEELTYTKADWARALKKVLGPEGWKKHQHRFPLLKDYWEVEVENHG